MRTYTTPHPHGKIPVVQVLMWWELKLLRYTPNAVFASSKNVWVVDMYMNPLDKSGHYAPMNKGYPFAVQLAH